MALVSLRNMPVLSLVSQSGARANAFASVEEDARRRLARGQMAPMTQMVSSVVSDRGEAVRLIEGVVATRASQI